MYVVYQMPHVENGMYDATLLFNSHDENNRDDDDHVSIYESEEFKFEIYCRFATNRKYTTYFLFSTSDKFDTASPTGFGYGLTLVVFVDLTASHSISISLIDNHGM